MCHIVEHANPEKQKARRLRSAETHRYRYSSNVQKSPPQWRRLNPSLDLRQWREAAMKALFETSLGPPARGDAPSDAVIFISMSSLYLTCSNYMTLRRGAGYFVFSYLSGVRLEPSTRCSLADSRVGYEFDSCAILSFSVNDSQSPIPSRFPTG